MMRRRRTEHAWAAFALGTLLFAATAWAVEDQLLAGAFSAARPGGNAVLRVGRQGAGGNHRVQRLYRPRESDRRRVRQCPRKTVG